MILGCDLAIVSGAAWGTPGSVPQLRSVRLGRGDDHATVFGHAVTYFGNLMRQIEPTCVVIEAPIPPHQVKGETQFLTSDLALGLRAIVLGLASARAIPTREVQISTWRKYAFGRRLNSQEAKSRAVALVKQLGWGQHGHDAAEAGLVWLWGCSQIAPQLVQRSEPLFAAGRAAGS